MNILGLIKISVIGLVLFFSLGAKANFVSTDAYIINDGLATLDTISGFEWLDLTETNFMSIPEITPLLTLSTSKYYGWRLPTAIEVNALMSRFFSTLNLTPVNQTIIAPLGDIHMFQSYFSERGSSLWTQGLYQSATNPVRTLMSGVVDAPYLYLYDDYFFNGANYKDGYSGVFLVSNGGVTLTSKNNQLAGVQVDSPIALMSVGLFFLFFGLRKKYF